MCANVAGDTVTKTTGYYRSTYFVPDRYKDGSSYETVSGNIRTLDHHTRTIILRDGTKTFIEDLVAIETKSRYD